MSPYSEARRINNTNCPNYRGILKDSRSSSHFFFLPSYTFSVGATVRRKRERGGTTAWRKRERGGATVRRKRERGRGVVPP